MYHNCVDSNKLDEFKEKDQTIIKLVAKCLDKDFDKRSNATEIITYWLDEIDQKDDNVETEMPMIILCVVY
ncbi:hypothetical protein C2G38_2228415 [Gigaspora rosea]|uniref:Uncharacterized protein n=1 Tax=Gigaspora rosea TaxID=44941 RepID=A0A397TVY3_9GLOM|nr:hypothetical protein C2G38_2228415 [Gigaspora rosea]